MMARRPGFQGKVAEIASSLQVDSHLRLRVPIMMSQISLVKLGMLSHACTCIHDCILSTTSYIYMLAHMHVSPHMLIFIGH